MTELDTVSTELLDRLAAAHARHGRSQAPRRMEERSPVQVLYGGAHLFRSDSFEKLGTMGRRAFDQYASTPEEMARRLGADSLTADAVLGAKVFEKVRRKLTDAPIEDYRIDFEDGLGVCAPDEEDRIACESARALASSSSESWPSRGVGIRIQPLSQAQAPRAMRTLELFLSTWIEAGAAGRPLVVTLPKVTISEEISTLRQLLERFEKRYRLPDETFGMEILVELAQAVMDETGRCPIPSFVDAGGSRLRAVHFGTYDFASSLGITAAYQSMDHDAALFALRTLQIALAGRGVRVSDGATTVIPVGPHRAGAGQTLSAREQEENAVAVTYAWRVMYRNVRRSLSHGIYQGWDLHPAQLPVRYAATYAFFLEALPEAARRLVEFVSRAQRASRVGVHFDDAATVRGLVHFFRQGLSCGALTSEELRELGVREDMLEIAFA